MARTERHRSCRGWSKLESVLPASTLVALRRGAERIRTARVCLLPAVASRRHSQRAEFSGRWSRGTMPPLFGNTSAGLAEGRSIAIVDLSGGSREFHTHFEDGTILATIDKDAARSAPDRGIYVRTYEDLSLPELWKKHLDGIARFRKHRNTQPIDHSACTDPATFAEHMDRLFQRITAVSAGEAGR